MSVSKIDFDFKIVVIENNKNDFKTSLFGIPIGLRTALMLIEFTNSNEIYLPDTTFDLKQINNVRILNTLPKDSNLIVINSSLLVDERFIKNFLREKFLTKIAVSNSDFSPIGFSMFLEEDLKFLDFKDIEKSIRFLAESQKQLRIAVISGKYYHYEAEGDFKNAEKFVLKSLYCLHDGIISSNLNRYFSVPLSRFFSKFSIHPNLWTLTMLLLGIIGALFVWQGTFYFIITGMSFIQISSIFSGIDGEIARMKFQKTKKGKFLNMFFNDLVTFAFLFSIAFPKNSAFSFDTSNKILLIIYPIYIFMKYIDALNSSNKKDPELFPVSKTGFYDSSSKILKILISFIKRDFIIFFAFIFSLFGKISYFATIYLSLVAFMIFISTIIFMKNFYRESSYDE